MDTATAAAAMATASTAGPAGDGGGGGSPSPDGVARERERAEDLAKRLRTDEVLPDSLLVSSVRFDPTASPISTPPQLRKRLDTWGPKLELPETDVVLATGMGVRSPAEQFQVLQERAAVLHTIEARERARVFALLGMPSPAER
eukprot:m.142419 g.142419  ORF g.142419 m.142419 type:complete len:144 (+) comp22921_c0_seq1:43-474(+)